MATEKEKMIAGELFDALCPELVADRKRARELTNKFNGVTEFSGRKSGLVRELFGSVGAKCYIEPPFRCDYGYNIKAGDNLYMNFNCVFLDGCEVSIGNNVMLGPNVQIYTASHPLLASERLKGKEIGKPISIGDNCWIGGSVVVNPGVSIGNNTTIGAGSVVTKNIPADVFAAGNPCKIIKRLDGH